MIKYIEHIILKSSLTNNPNIVCAFNKNKLYRELSNMKFNDELK